MTIEVTDADVEAVERLTGFGKGTWVADCTTPKEIIAAAWEVLQKKQETLGDAVKESLLSRV